MLNYKKIFLVYLSLELIDYLYWKYKTYKQYRLTQTTKPAIYNNIYSLENDSFVFLQKLKDRQLVHSDSIYNKGLKFLKNGILKDHRIQKTENINDYLKEINHIKLDDIKYTSTIHISFVIKLLSTMYYKYSYYKLTKNNYILSKYSNNSTSLYLKNNNSKHLLIIQHGLCNQNTNTLKFAEYINKNTNNKYDIVISVFHTLDFGYTQTNSDPHEYIEAIYNCSKDYNNISIISHSFGGYLSELFYQFIKSKNEENKIVKEIYIDSASYTTMGIISYSRLFYNNFFESLKQMNKDSKDYKNINFIFNLITYSSFYKIIMYFVIPYRGVLFSPRETQIHLLSKNDPLVNSSMELFKMENEIIHNNQMKFYETNGNHGSWLKEKNFDKIIELLQENV